MPWDAAQPPRLVRAFRVQLHAFSWRAFAP